MAVAPRQAVVATRWGFDAAHDPERLVPKHLRRYAAPPCSSFRVVVQGAGGVRARLRCGSFSCPECSQVQQARARLVALANAQAHGLRRMLTLTLPPWARDLPPADRHVAIMQAWNRFRTAWDQRERRAYKARRARAERRGRDPDALRPPRVLCGLWVKEVHKDGTPHLHLLVAHYMPIGEVRALWSQATATYERPPSKAERWGDLRADGDGASVVDVRMARSSLHGVAAYVTKYLSKSFAPEEDAPWFERGMPHVVEVDDDQGQERRRYLDVWEREDDETVGSWSEAAVGWVKGARRYGAYGHDRGDDASRPSWRGVRPVKRANSNAWRAIIRADGKEAHLRVVDTWNDLPCPVREAIVATSGDRPPPDDLLLTCADHRVRELVGLDTCGDPVPEDELRWSRVCFGGKTRQATLLEFRGGSFEPSHPTARFTLDTLFRKVDLCNASNPTKDLLTLPLPWHARPLADGEEQLASPTGDARLFELIALALRAQGENVTARDLCTSRSSVSPAPVAGTACSGPATGCSTKTGGCGACRSFQLAAAA